MQQANYIGYSGSRMSETDRPIVGFKSHQFEVVGDSIVFNPKSMTLGRFYVVELEEKPYLYRRVSETEVEIYGLADQVN